MFSLGRELLSGGGGLALLFILSLVLIIVGLGGMYLISAVLVLERFSRVARRSTSLWLMGALMTLLATAFQLASSRPELSDQAWSIWLFEGFKISPWTAGAVAVAMTSVRILLGRMGRGPVATGVLTLAAAGLGGWLGGKGMPSLPLGLAFLPALGAGGFFLMRRRQSNRGPATQGERELLRISGVILLGAGVALMPAPMREAAGLWGGWLLALLGVGILLGLVPLAGAGLLDMRGSAEWFIAVRYLVARRRQVFISAISAICVLGIASGVWLILVVLAVMNGFEQTWRDEILGHRAHFIVESSEGAFADHVPILAAVDGVPGVVAASPFLDVDGMVRGDSGEIFSLRLRGIDPLRATSVNHLDQNMLSGSLEALVDPDGPEGGAANSVPDPAIVVGSRLAALVGLDIGDELVVISPFGGPPTPLGPAPRLTRFHVAGVFRSSFSQYDEAFAYVSIAAAQKFGKAGDTIDGIEAITQDHYRSGRVGDAVVAALGPPFETRDWKEFFPAFFQALKTERIMMFLLLTMIMVVAAFVIVATLIMMIMEKTSDIAILKAMGAEDSLVERIFALEGALIGLLGTLAGLLGALAVSHRLSWIQQHIEELTGLDALPTSVYQFSSLPSRMDFLQVGTVILVAMILSLGSTLLPSRQAARVDPAEGLRHE